MPWFHGSMLLFMSQSINFCVVIVKRVWYVLVIIFMTDYNRPQIGSILCVQPAAYPIGFLCILNSLLPWLHYKPCMLQVDTTTVLYYVNWTFTIISLCTTGE